MQHIAQKIGEKLGLNRSEMHRLDLLITLHDIGKISIDEHILTKQGNLNPEEWNEIKRHPEIGYRIAMATMEFAHVAEELKRYAGKQFDPVIMAIALGIDYSLL